MPRSPPPGYGAMSSFLPFGLRRGILLHVADTPDPVWVAPLSYSLQLDPDLAQWWWWWLRPGGVQRPDGAGVPWCVTGGLGMAAAMSTEVRRWRAAGTNRWARGAGFFFFYSLSQNYPESLKAPTTHHCREPELRLTAKSSLPAELCHERYAGGHSRQRLFP
jgi:hypothetical protein